ncbi:MAG: glycosyltransferase involved in cell wall biosynthesis [Roseivirga sp.]|jgi:glycosyltransferase involved in cell wall biosynthesis
MDLEVGFIMAFSLLVGIQLYYHWHYFDALKLFKKEQSVLVPSVSVIVAARNEIKNLPQLLSTVLAQNYPKFELIVVNDRSTDGSNELLKGWQNQDARLTILNIDKLPDGWNGKKFALKKGIEVAKYECILLTDADCVPISDQWMRNMSSQFTSDADFVLGVSPYEKTNGFLNQIIQYETLLTAVQYLSYAIRGNPYMGVGRNLIYRKSLFFKNDFKGFEGKMGGDDDLFVNAHATSTNTKICIHPDALVISIPKKTWREYFIQKIRHLSVGKSYRNKDQARLGLFALSSTLGWVLLFLAIIIDIELTTILVIFGIRCLSFYIIFTRSGRKLNITLAFWALPLLDLCFNIYYPILGVVALTAKKIKWS